MPVPFEQQEPGQRAVRGLREATRGRASIACRGDFNYAQGTGACSQRILLLNQSQGLVMRNAGLHPKLPGKKRPQGDLEMTPDATQPVQLVLSTGWTYVSC